MRTGGYRKALFINFILIAALVGPFYSDAEWKKLAKKYNSKLRSLQSSLSGRFGRGRYRLMTTGETNVGGIGFWKNPAGYDDRYVCAFARVQMPRSSMFPDTKSGRVLTVMDAYGKDSIYKLANTLRSVDDAEGAAVIFIYGNGNPGDPSFDNSAEAMGLFMPRDSVLRFANLQMTIRALFSSSTQLPVLKGGSQIRSLKSGMLKP